MNIPFETLKKIITKRHTTKPAWMNGALIDDALIHELLLLADRAPTHARTEPWRFFVYKGGALEKFCEAHADIYWQNTEDAKRSEEKYDKLKYQYRNVSHLVIVVMKRTEGARIPAEEEYAAVCAAVENILLACEALDIAAIWSTGGMAHHDCFKQHLQLNEADRVVALLYLGRSDKEIKIIERTIPLTEKVVWE